MMEDNHFENTPCWRGAAGLTFIEILMAMLVVSVVTMAAYSLFASQQRAYESQYAAQERDQHLRFAVSRVVQEVIGAGHHAAGDALVRHLSDWVPEDFLIDTPLCVRLDANPKITLGNDGAPDMISFLSVLPSDTNPTCLRSPVIDTRVTTALSKTELKNQYRPGDLVCLGNEEVYARITAILSGELVIDTDPLTPGDQPVVKPIPAGSQVAEISVVSYTVFNRLNDFAKRHAGGRPELKRKVNAGYFQPVVENIKDMQLALEDDGTIKFTFEAITASPAGAKESSEPSGIIKKTLRVRTRNLSDVGVGSGCELPAAPTYFMVQAALDETYPCRILVSWDPVFTDTDGDVLEESCSVEGYRIFFDVAPKTFGYSIDVAPGTETKWVLDVQALHSNMYFVSVAAQNQGGVGEKSPEIQVRDLFAPARPIDLAVTLASDDEVSLTWQGPLDCDLAGFHVYRKHEFSAAYLRLSDRLISAKICSFLDAHAPAGRCLYAVEAEDYAFNRSGFSDSVAFNIPGLPLVEK